MDIQSHCIFIFSRTIADLAVEEILKIEHVAEAIQYRALDNDGWLG